MGAQASHDESADLPVVVRRACSRTRCIRTVQVRPINLTRNIISNELFLIFLRLENCETLELDYTCTCSPLR